MASSFQIVVPVFNEAEVLPRVLEHAARAGYLGRIIFVDDASTDASPAILREWIASHSIRAVFLDQNRRKEGAIREVLERVEAEGTLAPYTILLDADSMITPPSDGGSTIASIEAAISAMADRVLAGLAFRIDAATGRGANLLELCAFADYSGMQFDHWVTSHQRQVWVINGPGGLFNTGLLLETLRGMQPDFDTGDLLITVRLMAQGHPVSFYPEIQVKTFVPRTLAGYFRQCRRWERGTTKVVWWERAFYARLFTAPKLLAIATVIHLSLYVCLAAALVSSVASGSIRDGVHWVVAGYLVWLAINLGKGLWNRRMRSEGLWWRYVVFCALNGVLYIGVTTWARCAGFFDAVVFLLRQASPAASRRGIQDPISDVLLRPLPVESQDRAQALSGTPSGTGACV